MHIFIIAHFNHWDFSSILNQTHLPHILFRIWSIKPIEVRMQIYINCDMLYLI